MAFRLLPLGRVKTTRPVRAHLRRLPLPKGLFVKRSNGRVTLNDKDAANVDLGHVTAKRLRGVKTKARDEELDWSERSRETFERAMDKGTQYSRAALDAWDSANDKPAVIAIAVSGFIVLYAANATLYAMEGVPFLGGMLKVIGIYVTGWFIYRMIAFESDRDEVIVSFKNVKKEIVGE